MKYLSTSLRAVRQPTNLKAKISYREFRFVHRKEVITITNIKRVLLRHTADDPDMGLECLPECSVLNALDSELSTGLFYDLVDSRIMHMADLGEKMVLQLEIQSSEQPCQHLILSRKISCRMNLMYHPFFLQLVSSYRLKFCFFDHMGKLEYGSQTDPADYPGH